MAVELSQGPLAFIRLHDTVGSRACRVERTPVHETRPDEIISSGLRLPLAELSRFFTERLIGLASYSWPSGTDYIRGPQDDCHRWITQSCCGDRA